jgi:hypothetical protein
VYKAVVVVIIVAMQSKELKKLVIRGSFLLRRKTMEKGV